jgi:hypothetical protein
LLSLLAFARGAMRQALAYGKGGREIQPFRAWKIPFSFSIFRPYPLGREAAISQIDPAYCRVFSPDNAARLPFKKRTRILHQGSQEK